MTPSFQWTQSFHLRRNEVFSMHILFISGFYYNWYPPVNISLKSHRDFHKDPRQKDCSFSVYTLVLLSLQIRT